MSLFGDTAPERPRRRRGVLTVVALLAVAGAVTAAYVYLARGRDRAPAPARSPRPAPRASAAPTPVPERLGRPEAPAGPAATTRARLHVESDVAGASVFLDRQYVGKAPLTADDVEPGPHRLNVAAEGYETYAEELDLAPGTRQVTVLFKEVRLDESIEVVHKHTLGSCGGRLVATPLELRFESDREGDAFRAPLSDVERFAFDYLGKKLTVRIRGGRTYTFTPKDGNPDPLYVFHQRVDKVRRR